jgi:hypothetical protein
MRSLNLFVLADEAEAAEVGRACRSPADLLNRWPAVRLGPVGEDDLAWLGFGLNVCDEEDDSVLDELLFEDEAAGVLVCRVEPVFVEALGRLDADSLPRVAREWRDPDSRRCGGRQATAILGGMVALARQARSAAKSILWVTAHEG